MKKYLDSTSKQSLDVKVRPRVCMIQDGARRHYIVPVALQDAGILEMVYADWYVRRNSVATIFGGIVRWFDYKTGRKMLDRRRHELDDSKVRTNLSLAVNIALSRSRFPSIEQFYLWVAEQHYNWIRKDGLGDSNSIYGFIRNVDPRLFAFCRVNGVKVISDQIIAPAKIEFEEFQSQQNRWPGWEKVVTNDSQKLFEDLEEESWKHSDHIVCGSEYVKSGLVACGVNNEKVTVIPYAPSGADLPLIERKLKSNPIIVGFVGAVGLRKGAPYFFEVAKRFDPAKVKFVMVGGATIDKEILEREKGNVELVGAVPRSEVSQWLAKFHVYFFPSTCEGCAGSVLEAMDTGLPVVSTVNSGTIVSHGIEGFIHDYDDVEGFVESINKLTSNEELRRSMGLASRRRIEAFNIEWYSKTLMNLIESQLTV